MTGLSCMLGHKISHFHLWMFLWMLTLIMKAEKVKILTQRIIKLNNSDQRMVLFLSLLLHYSFFFFFGEQETKDILETSLEYSKAEYETTVE